MDLHNSVDGDPWFELWISIIRVVGVWGFFKVMATYNFVDRSFKIFTGTRFV